VKWILLLSTTLSIACSPALGMSRPVFVDETCQTMTEVPASDPLKALFKKFCRNDPSPGCNDWPAFARAVTANNINWRCKCKGECEGGE